MELEETDLKVLVNSFVSNPNKFLTIVKAPYEYNPQASLNKEKILNYLKSFDWTWVTSAPIKDVITGENIEGADNLYNDKVFEWSASDIYHFDKYNTPLSEEFLTHLAKKNYSLI